MMKEGKRPEADREEECVLSLRLAYSEIGTKQLCKVVTSFDLSTHELRNLNIHEHSFIFKNESADEVPNR